MSAWMKAGNTAVITGGASGIGLEAAARYATAGMNVVIADRNEETLRSASSALAKIAGSGDSILAHSCDVSDLNQVEILHDVAMKRFGSVHLLMNNAGMGLPVGAPWEDMDALKTTMSINLGGVINGCHAFIPAMLEHGKAGAVINTGSKQGITRPPGNYAYNLSKAGILAYTESVANAFVEIEGCQLAAHLLIPGFVYTPMISAHIPEKPAFAWTAEQTVDFMLERLDDNDFYILCPDGEATRNVDEKRIQWNADDIIKNRPALSRWHPDYADRFTTYMDD
ncbi:SDR family NAD(P)-dependent oxidoreductase [Sphingorhabdus sp. Alg231-15]|uniref:SDR family NAD(P)-dependent oxidoreductase n=1 Tax=Sphingorhabdus sp. Alg231-15 TaxID=1922222 RepID=UPI000D55B5A8